MTAVERDSLTIRARAHFAVSEFQALWQGAWRESETLRRSAATGEVNRRRDIYVHCHVNDFDRTGMRNVVGEGVRDSPDPQFVLILSRQTRFGLCPSWLLSRTFRASDEESSRRDAALAEHMLPFIRKSRQVLLDNLASASRLLPRDTWIIGQQVRFLLDQGHVDKADSLTANCGALGWWCSALAGRVLAHKGDFTKAADAFAKMRAIMPDSIRCLWDDVRYLLPVSERASYANLSCQERGKINETLWWLSDPLFRHPANERAIEQDVRLVEVEMRRTGLQDERYTYDERRGGDAIAAVLYRYGWPSYTGWGGARIDFSHDIYLLRNESSPPVSPYTSFEYLPGRVRTLPTWNAVEDPFHSRATDWMLSRFDDRGLPDFEWWPESHFKPSRPLIQLPEGQFVFLRRQSHVEIAAAVQLEHPAINRRADTFDMMLLTTRSANEVDSIDRRSASANTTVVLRGPSIPGPAILAIEGGAEDGPPLDARLRLGINAPESLGVMRDGELALSTPALLFPDPAKGVTTLPTPELLHRMIGTTRLLRSMRRVTVYWESYGIRDTDSAATTIRVATDIEIGALRRVGIAAGIAVDPNSAISIRWTEADTRRSTTSLAGPVPVQVRAALLDLSNLRPGSYVIEIEMTLVASGRRVASQRRIELL